MTLEQAQRQLDQLLARPEINRSILNCSLPAQEINQLVDQICDLILFIERETLRLRMWEMSLQRGTKTTPIEDIPDPIDIDIKI